jgi:hypothetical protein
MAATTPVASGGTGSTTAAGARTNLGLVIGTDIPSPTGTGASGTWSINISGSAATLTTARTINGTSFNGSADITLGAPTVAAGTNYYLGTGISSPAFNNVSGLARRLTTKMLVSGTVRVQWYISGNLNSSTFISRVYKNGVAQGTSRSTTAATATYTEDVAVAVGDNIEIYASINDADPVGVVSGINIGTSTYTTFATHLGATLSSFNVFTGV